MRARTFADAPTSRTSAAKDSDIEAILAKPAWSIASLLSSEIYQSRSPEVSPEQLRHLLRLSALPSPRDADEEKEMLSTLAAQLHFVREIQKVDTTGVEALSSLRDESKQGQAEAEIGLETLREALSRETTRGKHHKRIRRNAAAASTGNDSPWSVLGLAKATVGRYFVVEGGKAK